MKVLFVYSGNTSSSLDKNKQPFVNEQIDVLEQVYSIEVFRFLIRGKGHLGYLKNWWPYRKFLSAIKPDLIHAHYGLSGLLAGLQFNVPIVTTFHGTDVNDPVMLSYSRIAHARADHSIVVESSMAARFSGQHKITVIPCGVDLSVFFPVSQSLARRHLNIPANKKLVLFASSFNNAVKNYPLAAEALKISGTNAHMQELYGMTREEVNLWLNAADVALMTSFTEGSPQFIKEAMATNCPIVSTDVGDVASLIHNIEGCHITSFNATEIADKLNQVFRQNQRTRARDRIQSFDNRVIAERIWSVYDGVFRK